MVSNVTVRWKFSQEGGLEGAGVLLFLYVYVSTGARPISRSISRWVRLRVAGSTQRLATVRLHASPR